MYDAIVIGADGPHSEGAAAAGPAMFLQFGVAMRLMMAEAPKGVPA